MAVPSSRGGAILTVRVAEAQAAKAVGILKCSQGR
jgi:hypothetical protein